MLEGGDRRRAAQLDLATGTVLLGVCAIGAWSLAGNSLLHNFDYGSDPGPGLVPALLLGVLALCALAMVAIAAVRLWTARDHAASEPAPPMNWKSLVLPACMTVSLLLYVRYVTDFGFLSSTIVFALLWCLLIGLQDNPKLTPGRLLLMAVEAVAIAGGIYLVFVKLIEVQLP